MVAHPVELSFQDVPYSDATQAAVSRFAARLDRLRCGITRCRVILTSGQATKRGPRCPFTAHIEVETPGRRLVSDAVSDIDVHVALLGAFQDMVRTMQLAGPGG